MISFENCLRNMNYFLFTHEVTMFATRRLFTRVVKVGDFHVMKRTFTQIDVVNFAKLIGDSNPIHLNKEIAQKAGFKDCIVHGMLVSSLFSTALGMHLPGPQTIYLSQQVDFKAPVMVGDTVEAKVCVKEFSAKKGLIALDTKVVKTNEKGEEVVCVVGTAVGMNKAVTFDGESEWSYAKK